VRFTTLLLAGILAAGLVISAAAPTYPQGPTGGHIITPCDVDAYVIDRDPNGMNVRSGPGSTYKIIGNLPNQDVNGISVHITGSQGDWMRVDIAVEEGGDEDRTFFKGEGWLYGPLLGVDGIGGGTKLYRQPSSRSGAIGNLPGGGDGATVRGCQGKWMYVEYRKLKGWAAPDTLCTNPLTTCP